MSNAKPTYAGAMINKSDSGATSTSFSLHIDSISIDSGIGYDPLFFS